MKAFAMLNRRNRSGGEFLLIEAATAHSLLDIAETSLDAIQAYRDTQLAREALIGMNQYLQALEMDISLRAVLERSRDKLESRLAAMEDWLTARTACRP